MTKKELLEKINHAAEKKVTKLNLFGMKIAELPAEIGRLTNLTRLNLFNNQLTSLPAEIGRLTNLTGLSLSNNQLTSLPAEIVRLTNLTLLYLHHNQLTALPAEIGRLTNLTVLYLHHNQLTSLPAEIGRLTNLTGLVLSGNPLPIPPEILAKAHEPATILNYYFKHIAGEKRPLNEAKMLLVGQGYVGKTSLVNRLLKNEFNPAETKTDGIDITKWPVRANDEDIRVNIWDFGGQEIMHATHQFFLTKRSLYLLVLNARKEEEENRLEYWLKIIQSFGGDAPIIIVGNRAKEHPLDLARRGLQAKYPQIKGFVETDCESGKGIDELKAIISREIDKLEHVHDDFLGSWFVVKEELEKKKTDYIPYTDYRALCREHGIVDELDQRTLIGFLHDLGLMLNFQDHLILKDTNVLNPEWVTDGVYKIINNPELLREKEGVLDKAMVTQILDDPAYPEDKHIFIIEMMRNFELCYEMTEGGDTKYLIPDLLPKSEAYTGSWDNALGFAYHYNVLPGSIISRFIVRMNQYIHKKTYWRKGVVLRHRGNRALVAADIEDRKITISVDGPANTRRDLLAAIRQQFDAIHKTIPRIEAEEQVPLPDDPGVTVSYEHLLFLEREGEESYIPEGATRKYNVKELLNGVEPEAERRKRREDHFAGERRGPEPELYPRDDTREITHFRFLREAIKAVPSVKYALGVGGIAMVIAIVASFNISLSVAFFGALVMFIPMVLLVVFARFAGTVSTSMQRAVIFLTWFVLLVFAVIVILFLGSVFFKWPIDLQYLITGSRGG